MHTLPSDDGLDASVSSRTNWGLTSNRTSKMSMCRPKIWKYLSITLSFALAAQLLAGAFSRRFDPLAYVMSVHQRIHWKNLDELARTSNDTNESINGTETSAQEGTQDSNLLSKEKPLCPPVPPYLVGRLAINRTVPPLEEQERAHPELEPGGRYRPGYCRARHRVAIVIPYRDRAQHLSVFLFHMHPVLQRQQLDYDIYIVEQAGTGKFNRAMLMNVGALESLKQYPYDCYIFHDIDLLPEDDRNLYTCPEQPRHMSIAVDTLNYRLPYENIFGGVSALTVDQFKQVNGFSNSFWGWGGEDDDMSHRIRYYGFFLSRYPAHIGRYTMLSHKKDAPNPERYEKLYNGEKRFKTDGINSIKYKVLDIQLRRLYTWVHVELYPS